MEEIKYESYKKFGTFEEASTWIQRVATAFSGLPLVAELNTYNSDIRVVVRILGFFMNDEQIPMARKILLELNDGRKLIKGLGADGKFDLMGDGLCFSSAGKCNIIGKRKTVKKIAINYKDVEVEENVTDCDLASGRVKAGEFEAMASEI